MITLVMVQIPNACTISLVNTLILFLGDERYLYMQSNSTCPCSYVPEYLVSSDLSIIHTPLQHSCITDTLIIYLLQLNASHIDINAVL